MDIHTLKVMRKCILADNLKRLMQSRNLTVEQVCVDLGIRRFTFYCWIYTITYPQSSKIEMLAKYFGVKKSELTEYNGDSEDNDYTLKDLDSLRNKEKAILLKCAKFMQNAHDDKEYDNKLTTLETVIDLLNK